MSLYSTPTGLWHHYCATLDIEFSTIACRLSSSTVPSAALLRSVGHVLRKVNSRRNPRIRRAVDEAWKRWISDRETHAIFWEFIREERNNILKEYEFGFLSGPVDVLVTPDDESFVLDENLFCPISGGRFAGEDCRDVLADAIAWWERELSTIDSHEGG